MKKKFKRRKLLIYLIFFGALLFVIKIIHEHFKISENNQNFLESTHSLKSWEVNDLLNADSLRSGFGEHGQSATLTKPSEITENDKLFQIFGFSVLISDKISVNRSIPDFRHPQCLTKLYPSTLPPVSIVIIFNDEATSVFKRTLHSLYNRTPHELITEVILVDDNSRKGLFGDELQNYVKENFSEISFKIIRLKSRQGLMKARKIGAKAAKSDFLFVMEPHCELSYNWLPPLLTPLLNDPHIVTVPIIDNVEWKELQFYGNDKGNLGSRGVFDWNLEYQKLKRFEVNESEALKPFETPIMTGGIFLIRKKYFLQLGPYDEKLRIWGGENIEMSLKIHLCGGKLMEVPCSHIGHMFRAFTKSRKDENGLDFLTFNRKRIVEVWFDEYKKFVYAKNSKFAAIRDVGNLSEAKKFREKLNCKSFNFFLDSVAPDLLEKFPVEVKPFASGQLRHEKSKLCLKMGKFDEKSENIEVRLEKCEESDFFELSWYRDVRTWDGSFCLDAYDITKATFCHVLGGNQLFKYDLISHQLVNLFQNLCLEVQDKSLKMAECDKMFDDQKWIFTEFVNKTALNRWHESGRKFEEENSPFWS